MDPQGPFLRSLFSLASACGSGGVLLRGTPALPLPGGFPLTFAGGAMGRDVAKGEGDAGPAPGRVIYRGG